MRSVVAWKLIAGLTVFVVAALIGGAGVRLLGVADAPEAVLSLGILAVAVIAAAVLGAWSRRLETPYW